MTMVASQLPPPPPRNLLMREPVELSSTSQADETDDADDVVEVFRARRLTYRAGEQKMEE